MYSAMIHLSRNKKRHCVFRLHAHSRKMFRLVTRTRPSVTRNPLVRTPYRVYTTAPKQHYPPEEEANRIFEEARKYWTPQLLNPEDVQRRVVAVVKAFEKVDHPEKVTPQSHFQKDLGLDSLDTIDLLMEMEDEFVVEVPDLELEKIRSISEAISYFSTHPYAK